MAANKRIGPVKLVLGRIYFVYIALLFVLTMLLVWIPIWFISRMREPQKSQALHKAFRIWMGVYMPLIFCPVRRRGTEYFAPGQNYVVVCNHNSFMDVPVTSPWIPGPNKTLAKAEIARVPLFGLIYTAGSILVDRKSETSRRDSFSRMNQALRLGLHLCLYPEGTRNKGTVPLQAFQKGAFITAIQEQKPIMPAAMTNTAWILPPKPAFYAWPRPIDFHFLPPIATSGKSVQDVEALKEEVWIRMRDYLLTHKMV